MAKEAVEFLNPKPDGIYIDATLGGGGHTLELLKASAPTGKVIAIDRDIEAIERGRKLLKEYEGRVDLVQSSFAELEDVLTGRITSGGIDGIVADFGVSSFQLDTPERGFSFRFQGRLDMRMDQSQDCSAYDLVNELAADKLAAIFKEYGEERFAKLVSRAIVEKRKDKPIETTTELVEIIEQSIGGRSRRPGGAPPKIHPATRVFQALRIAVNDELGEIKRFLEAGVKVLKPGGRIAVISFHSLEDRIVKNFFRTLEKGCTCPPRIPQCVCGKESELKLLTRRVVKPDEAEIESNPRARSARLRAAEKIFYKV
jgi:16S rRNA (cytosine1402-N4)-methyltransferase